MHINDDGMFTVTASGKVTGVHASQKRGGRWQYRHDNKGGKLIASGMSPAEFVKSFWYRDDFTN